MEGFSAHALYSMRQMYHSNREGMQLTRASSQHLTLVASFTKGSCHSSADNSRYQSCGLKSQLGSSERQWLSLRKRGYIRKKRITVCAGVSAIRCSMMLSPGLQDPVNWGIGIHICPFHKMTEAFSHSLHPWAYIPLSPPFSWSKHMVENLLVGWGEWGRLREGSTAS